MRNSLKVSRGAQLIGALFLIASITSCANGGLDGSGFVGGSLFLGLVLILGGRVHEWMTKE